MNMPGRTGALKITRTGSGSFGVKPTEWALRPVSKQERDAAHTAVTW